MGKSKEKGGAKAAAEKGSKKRAKSKVKAKQKGMRWVNPYLTVRDPAASLAWYERAFGFKTAFAMPGPDGKIMHAEMRYKKSVIMLGPESPDGRCTPPAKQSGGAPVTLYTFCDDVDAVAASAKVAGAKVLQEPQDMFYGDRTCFVVDPDGHQWMFATHQFDWDPTSAPPPACPEAAKSEAKSAAKLAEKPAEAAKSAPAAKPGAAVKPAETPKAAAPATK
jgi:PhnB protein